MFKRMMITCNVRNWGIIIYHTLFGVRVMLVVSPKHQVCVCGHTFTSLSILERVFRVIGLSLDSELCT